MKFAFSTLACPGWDWEDVTSTAKDLGYDGIELRGIGNEIHIPKTKPFLPENLESTLHNLKRLDLDIHCITSSCHLFDKSNITSFIDEGRQYIELAAKTGTPFIRVLGDENPEPGSSVDAGFVSENLSVLAEYAKSSNVTVLIETNGIFARSEEIIKCVERTGKSN
ncbi:MAG TPA: TIM barrel protein, partial [Clostridia bacterium]